jgi:rubrerythrin
MTSTLPPEADMRTTLTGSPWDENLLQHFREHVEGEREVLEAYAELAESAREDIRYLVELILDDEARHHRLLHEMINRVRSDIDYREYGPRVPYLEKTAADRARLLEVTQRFLELERKDDKALKKLQKELAPVRDTTLFPLLVELMQLDTKKHVTILEFIRRTAKKRW